MIPWPGFEVDAAAICVRLTAEKGENGLPMRLRLASSSTRVLLSAEGILQCAFSLNSLNFLVSGSHFVGRRTQATEGFRNDMNWRRKALTCEPERATNHSDSGRSARRPRLKGLEAGDGRQTEVTRTLSEVT